MIFTLSCWVGCQNYLINNYAIIVLRLQPRQEVSQVQLAWTNVSYRRETSVKNVVDTFEASRLLNGHETVRLLNYTNDGMISSWRRTEATGIHFGEIIADRAQDDSLLNFSEGSDQSLQICVRSPH